LRLTHVKGTGFFCTPFFVQSDRFGFFTLWLLVYFPDPPREVESPQAANARNFKQIKVE